MTEDKNCNDLETAMQIIKKQAEAIKTLTHRLEIAEADIAALVAEKFKWESAYIQVFNAGNDLVETILDQLEAAREAGLQGPPVQYITPLLKTHIRSMREISVKVNAPPMPEADND